MIRVSVAGHPLTATGALVWHGDLPRPLQQILFDTADGVAPPDASSPSAAARPGQDRAAQPTDGEAPATWAPQLAAGRSLAGLCPAAGRRGSAVIRVAHHYGRHERLGRLVKGASR